MQHGLCRRAADYKQLAAAEGTHQAAGSSRTTSHVTLRGPTGVDAFIKLHDVKAELLDDTSEYSANCCVTGRHHFVGAGGKSAATHTDVSAHTLSVGLHHCC